MLLTLFAKFRIWGVGWVRVVLLAKVSQYFSAEKMLKGCPGPGRKGMESDGMGWDVMGWKLGPVNDNGVCTVVDTLFQFSHQTWLLPGPHPLARPLIVRCLLCYFSS